MREVYIVKQAVATVLGDSTQTTWQNLLAGQSAFDSAPVARVPDLAPAGGENRVCALTRRVLEALAPVPAEACLIWTGIKGNAEFIEAGQAAGMPWLAEHYQKWAADILGTGTPRDVSVERHLVDTISAPAVVVGSIFLDPATFDATTL